MNKQERYVLIIENYPQLNGPGERRLTIILVDTEKASPVLDGTIAVRNLEEMENMFRNTYGDDLRVIKPIA